VCGPLSELGAKRGAEKCQQLSEKRNLRNILISLRAIGNEIFKLTRQDTPEGNQLKKHEKKAKIGPKREPQTSTPKKDITPSPMPRGLSLRKGKKMGTDTNSPTRSENGEKKKNIAQEKKKEA